jgi:DNA-binding SARP family transcriptional activator
VLRLLAGFGVEVEGEEVALPGSAQRVVAFVALHERPVLRPYVAGTLWLDWPETRAAGNLRSALWRIQQHAPELVAADPHMLRLAPGVRVDLREAETLAHSELASSSSGIAQQPLALDLLPDWYEDWVLLERERFRQLRLRALECRCTRLTAAGRLDEGSRPGCSHWPASRSARALIGHSCACTWRRATPPRRSVSSSSAAGCFSSSSASSPRR